MKIHKYTEREIKITAILYATREEIVKHVRSSGRLPKRIPLGGFPTAMNVLVKRRGVDSVMSEDERLVYDAILREKVLPGGGVILAEDYFPIYSVEAGQHIEVLPGSRDMTWED
jgi:hypothetical protein